MGWREAIVRLVGGDRYVAKEAIPGFTSSMGGMFTGRGSLGSRAKQMEAYQGWVATVTNKIAGTISGLQPKLYKQTGRRDEWPEVDNHPLLDLLANPNPIMSRGKFARVMQLQLDLTGMQLAQVYFNRLGRPQFLWPISPHLLREIKTTGDITKPIEAFIFDDGKGGKITLERDEVWYNHYPHPMTPIYGASPIQQQAFAYDVDLALRTYNRNFLQNGAKFDFALTTDQHMSEADARRVQGQFIHAHGGPDKAGTPPVLFGGLNLKQMSASAKDAEFAWLAGWSQDMILAAYEVPAGKLGLVEDVNRANMTELDTTYHRECIGPRVGYWNDGLTWLAAKFDPSLWCELDHEVPKDREFEHKRQMERLDRGAALVNEVRDEDGLDPVPGGDIPRAQANMMPLSVAPPAGDQGGQQQLDAAAPVAKDAQAEAEFRQFAQAIEAWVLQMKPRLAGVFARQEAVVLARLKDAWPKVLGRFAGWSAAKVKQAIAKAGLVELELIFADWSVWSDELRQKAWEQVMPGVLAEGGAEALAAMGLTMEFNLADPAVVNWLAKSAATAARVNDFTREAIRRNLSQAAEAGETLEQASERMRAVFDWCQDARAETIARTEIANSRRFGAHEALVQSGAPFLKEWAAEPGARDSHAAAARTYGAGKGIGLHELFSVGGCACQAPGLSGCPGEDINCRCYVRYRPDTRGKATLPGDGPAAYTPRAYSEEECR